MAPNKYIIIFEKIGKTEYNFYKMRFKADSMFCYGNSDIYLERKKLFRQLAFKSDTLKTYH